MRISFPSRKTRARNPSHFGSKIHFPPNGNSEARLASIGRIGGFTGSCMGQSYTAGLSPATARGVPKRHRSRSSIVENPCRFIQAPAKFSELELLLQC